MRPATKNAEYKSLFIDLASQDRWAYWANKLGCTETKLMDAVAYVGPCITDIRRFLENRAEEVAEAARP